MSKSLYETDFYSWSLRQAEALRSGQTHLLDIENVAEELATLGRSEAVALRLSYRLICMHILKMMHQPGKATVSWDMTVQRERLNAALTLEDNPGLTPRRRELFERAYVLARKEAAIETTLAIGQFPKDPPFTVDAIESDAFWPAGFPMTGSKP